MPREDGYFKKGNSGKPKGVKHKNSQEIREFIQRVVDNRLETLEDDLDRMSPTNRWLVLDKLTKYFLPTLSKNENLNQNEGGIKIMVEYQEAKAHQLDNTSTLNSLASDTPTPLANDPDSGVYLT
jgi:hypothetical protein